MFANGGVCGHPCLLFEAQAYLPKLSPCARPAFPKRRTFHGCWDGFGSRSALCRYAWAVRSNYARVYLGRPPFGILIVPATVLWAQWLQNAGLLLFLAVHVCKVQNCRWLWHDFSSQRDPNCVRIELPPQPHERACRKVRTVVVAFDGPFREVRTVVASARFHFS